MIRNIILFEPKRVENFYPFSVLHSIWELRTGPFMIFEKYKNHYPESNLNFFGRKDHLNSFLARFELECNNLDLNDSLFIDASVLPDKKFLEDLFVKTMDAIYKEKEALLFKDASGFPFAIFLKNENSKYKYFLQNETINLNDKELENIEVQIIENVNILNYLWDTLDYVALSIENDLEFFINYRSFKKIEFPNVSVVNSENLKIGSMVKIDPGVVLDASEGPIIIDDNSRIMPQATIIGPCYIGKNNIVKIGAKIYENNAFGEWCKIGGEIENAIIQSYSNKQHEGFLGHSFLSEWVNLGADTNCSDLKNTYSDIKVNLNGETVDTERMFLGVMCGDHTKTGINAMFTTGTIAGICGILVRDWFMPKFIKSFSWGGKSDSPKYKFSKAIETTKIVMARRGKELLAEEEKLIFKEYERS